VKVDDGSCFMNKECHRRCGLRGTGGSVIVFSSRHVVGAFADSLIEGTAKASGRVVTLLGSLGCLVLNMAWALALAFMALEVVGEGGGVPANGATRRRLCRVRCVPRQIARMAGDAEDWRPFRVLK